MDFNVTVDWQREPSEVFTDGQYHRAHDWRFDGGAVVYASSSPHVVKTPLSDPTAVDPEEAFVASIASCHMLFFLAFAAKAGLTIDRYIDTPQGTMTRDDSSAEKERRSWISEVILKPQVTWMNTPPPFARIEHLHHQAHAHCFIARSIRTEVKMNLERS